MWGCGENSEPLKMTTTAATIIVSIELDMETVDDIAMLRSLRLDYYADILRNPEAALINLKSAGLTEISSGAQVSAYALAKITEIEARLSDPSIIYDDEISAYVDSLPDTDETKEFESLPLLSL